MGYHTDFYGSFKLNKHLDEITKALLQDIYDHGDSNAPVAKYSSCQWIYDDDYDPCLVWDQGVNFYEYIGWIRYLVETILAPRGYILNGSVDWEAQDRDDVGRILIENNKIRIQKQVIFWEDCE